MKIHLSILVLGLLTLLSKNSIAEKTTAKGYYIDNKNDSIETVFIIPVALVSDRLKLEEIYQSFQYKNTKGKTKNIYSETIKKVSFYYQDTNYTFVPIKKTDIGIKLDFLDDPQTIFVRELVNGYTSVYARTFYDSEGYTGSTYMPGGGFGGSGTMAGGGPTYEFLATEYYFKTSNDSMKSTKIRIKWPNTIKLIWGENYMYESFKLTESFIKSYFVNCPYMTQYIALNYDSYNKIKMIVEEANKSCQ